MPPGEQFGQTVLATHATRSEAVAHRDDDMCSYLVVIANNEVVGRYPLGPDPLTVGRDESRHVILPDARVSRLHLQVYVRDDNVYVEDLGSSNGTFLDGNRLTRPTLLAEGRWVDVGSRRLKHERRSRREVERAEELQRELEKALSYVRSLLPEPISSGPILSDWFYEPSTALGGDAFSYDWLDDTHLIAYLIDVSGHGVGAAMHSVSILNLLRQRALPATDFRQPAQVLDSLNTMFPMENHDGMYFTIWYGVYSIADRRLDYASAGHHASYLLEAGKPPVALRTRGPMIGAVPTVRYHAASTQVAPGATLYLFSDGAFEVVTPDGVQLGLDDFLPLLDARSDGLQGETQRIYRAVCEKSKPGPLDDDFSLLALRFC